MILEDGMKERWREREGEKVELTWHNWNLWIPFFLSLRSLYDVRYLIQVRTYRWNLFKNDFKRGQWIQIEKVKVEMPVNASNALVVGVHLQGLTPIPVTAKWCLRTQELLPYKDQGQVKCYITNDCVQYLIFSNTYSLLGTWFSSAQRYVSPSKRSMIQC